VERAQREDPTLQGGDESEALPQKIYTHWDLYNIMLCLTNVMRLDKGQYKLVKALCRYSKNLYNQGLYNTRQEFFNNNRFLQYQENYHLCKESENYRMLQAATSQQSLKFVERSMRSFFVLRRLYWNGDLPERPSLPHYLPKEKGLFAVAFPKNAFSIRDGIVHLGVSRSIIEDFPDAHRQLTFPLPPSSGRKKDSGNPYTADLLWPVLQDQILLPG
jgi:hypothetical protein